jgi:MFS family permease
MRNVPNHITAALEALKFCGARREGLRTLNYAEWTDLLSRWRFLRLMVPLRLECGDDLPEWVRAQIDGNISDNAKRFERIKAVYLEFVDALRETRGEHLVLKGFAQAPDYVEHPRFRLQSDIDIFCPPRSILRARNALSRLGYEPSRSLELPPREHLPAMERRTCWEWRGNPYDPEIPISWELHYRFWNEIKTRISPKGLDQFWLRRVERRLDNFSFPSLNPADQLAYVALNVLRDAFNGDTHVHLLYELARFLHLNADNESFWKDWRELHHNSLRSLEVISFRLAFHCFACRLPEAVKKEIDCSSAAIQAWFQRYADSPIRALLRPNKDVLWLHLAMLESPRDKRAILFKRLFPTYAPPVGVAAFQNPVRDEDAGPSRLLWRGVRYVSYLIPRAAYHLRVIPSTLWHGVGLWWSAKNLRKDFLTFFAASSLFNLGAFIFFFLYNLYLLDRGFREDLLGLVASANAIGSVAGTLPAGMLAQRIGLRKTLLLCFTTVSLIMALQSLLALRAPLVALSFLAGAASTIYAVAFSPAIAQLTSEQNRPFGFSLLFSSGIAIGVCGSQAGGLLPGWLAHIGPLGAPAQAKQASLLIACGLVALGALAACGLKFAPMPVQETKLWPRNPFLLRFLPAIAIWSLVTGAFSPFANVYFAQHLRMPAQRIGMVFTASQLSQVVAMLAAPSIFRRFGLVNGIVYTQVATALTLGGLAVGPAPSAAMVYACYTAFEWMNEPGMYSLLMNQVKPAEQTGASALNFLVISLAQAIAAAAAGDSFARFGYPAVIGVTAGVALAAAFLFRLLLGNAALCTREGSPARLGL